MWLIISLKARREKERETKTYVFLMLVRVVNTTRRGPKIQLPGGSEYSSVRHHGHSEAVVIGFWTLLLEFWSVFKSFRQIKNLVFYSKPQYSGFHKPKILWIPGLSLCYRQETQEVSLKPPVQFLEKISFARYSIKWKALSRLIYNQHELALIWNNFQAVMFKISN